MTTETRPSASHFTKCSLPFAASDPLELMHCHTLRLNTSVE